MFNFINLLLLSFILIKYKKIILKYIKKIFNIKIIILGLVVYVLLVLIIGACPLYR